MVMMQLRSDEAWHRKADSEKNYKYEGTALEVESVEGRGNIHLYFQIEPREIESTEVGVTIKKEDFKPLMEAMLRALGVT